MAHCHSCARLILYSILHCRWGDLLALVGLLCSTWVAVNSGTSQRDVLTPMGHPEFPSVQCGNQMVSRWGFSNLEIVKGFPSPQVTSPNYDFRLGIDQSYMFPKKIAIIGHIKIELDRNKLVTCICSLKICFGGPLHYRGWWGAYSGESSIKSDYASRPNGVASSTTIKIQDRGTKVALIINILEI